MTEKGPNGYYVRPDKGGATMVYSPGNEPAQRFEGSIVDRLAAYESLNMEPEVISELQVEAALDYMELQKELQKWKDLERSGRIVVMPDPKETPVLGKGTPVWYVDRESGEIESGKILIPVYKNGELDKETFQRACQAEPFFLAQERKFDPLDHIMEGRKKWAIKFQLNTDGSTIFYGYVCPKCMYEADEPLEECPGCGKDMRTEAHIAKGDTQYG